MTITNINKHDSVTIVEPVNLYGCTLEKNVFVGPFVEIQADSFVGENTRIQSHSLYAQMSISEKTVLYLMELCLQMKNLQT